jgi:uncharacterized membrane protein YkoI
MPARGAFLIAVVALMPGMLQSQAAPATTPASASQAPVPLTQEKPGLLAQAKVTDEAARKTALARAPGGSIVKAELEKEKGKLIFSYDIKIPGKDGIQEVTVDATSGAVLSVEHESSASEAKEDSAEAKRKSS